LQLVRYLCTEIFPALWYSLQFLQTRGCAETHRPAMRSSDKAGCAWN
jgi:hypothetical protein